MKINFDFELPVSPGPRPWSDAVCDALNKQQKSGRYHPMTCGNRKNIKETHADGEGVLVATASGWICPWCDYTQ